MSRAEWEKKKKHCLEVLYSVKLDMLHFTSFLICCKSIVGLTKKVLVMNLPFASLDLLLDSLDVLKAIIVKKGRLVSVWLQILLWCFHPCYFL